MTYFFKLEGPDAPPWVYWLGTEMKHSILMLRDTAPSVRMVTKTKERAFTFISATDFPRPPTNLNLSEEVPNTVTLKWDHSPDVKDAGGAHYVILKRDTSTATWFTAAEKVYSNKYTVTGLLPGRKYFFRVIARNDIGDSDPLDSKDSWHLDKDKGMHAFSHLKQCYCLDLNRFTCKFVRYFNSWRQALASSGSMQK